MILPHDLLFTLAEDQVADYCSYGPSQQGVLGDLQDWGYQCDVNLNDGIHTAALALWGDAAPYATRDSIYLLVLTILSGQHREYYWLSCITKRRICACGCQGRHTFDRLFMVLSWSFRACLAARHPCCDHLGHHWPIGSRRAKLAAGPALPCRGALLRFLGDWAWFKQSLGLRGWRGEGPEAHICFRCSASVAGRHPAYDFSPGASWRAASTSMASFWTRSRFERMYVSELWRTPGFNIKWVEPDFMHCVDLGILQVLQGNIMWELFRSCDGTIANPRRALALLNNMIKTV